MGNLDSYKLLSYAALGLGCILAILAYFLLQQERRQEIPRKAVLATILGFMAGAAFLSVSGLLNGYLPDADARRMRQMLPHYREALTKLMDPKSGKVSKLQALDADSPAYAALVKEIQYDLFMIDDGIRDMIAK